MELLNQAPASDTVILSRFRVEVPLIGPKDRFNKVFATPAKFLPTTLALYFNGLRMRRGVGEDYTVAESGGPGSGYDTITVFYAPNPADQLFADYIQA